MIEITPADDGEIAAAFDVCKAHKLNGDDTVIYLANIIRWDLKLTDNMHQATRAAYAWYIDRMIKGE